MSRRARSSLAVLLCALVLAACGIPTSNDAETVPRHEVPFHLLSPVAPTTTSTTLPAIAYVTERIYLINPKAKLVTVVRDIPVPAPLESVLDALIDGPTAAETALGLTTALPSSVKVLSATTNAGVATLNLNGAFGQISGSAETSAVAQLVLTTSLEPQITGVSFEIAGKPISVPTASGAVATGPVTASDYASLVASTSPSS